jgi:hypothetical protein
VIVSDKTNHKIQEMTDIPEMIEVQEILVMEIHAQVEMILDLKNQKRVNF